MEKIIGILFLVPSSMLSTISALASQNIGAGKHDARLTLRYVLYMTVGYGLAAATIVQFLSVPFVGLFTNDGAVQILGGQYLRSYAWDCVFAGVHFCLSGYFYAYGLSIVSFIHNSISIVCAEFHCLIMRQRIFRIHYFRWGVRHRQDRWCLIIICVGVFVWMNKHTENIWKEHSDRREKYDDRNYRRRHIITSGTQNSTAKRRLSDRIRIYKTRGSYYNYRQ